MKASGSSISLYDDFNEQRYSQAIQNEGQSVSILCSFQLILIAVKEKEMIIFSSCFCSSILGPNSTDQESLWFVAGNNLGQLGLWNFGKYFSNNYFHRSTSEKSVILRKNLGIDLVISTHILF